MALHALFQSVSIFAVFAAWYWVFISIIEKDLVGNFWSYSLYAGIAIGALLFRSAYKANEDAAQLSGLFMGRLKLAGSQTLFIGTVVVFFLVATKDREISRVFLFSWIPVLYATLVGTNLGMPHLVLPLAFGESNRQKFLLATSNPGFRQPERLAEWLQRQQRMGIRVAGVVAPGHFNTGKLQAPWLGSPEELEGIFENHSPDVLLWLEPPADRMQMMRYLNLAERRGARLIFWDDLQQRFGARAWSAEIDGLNFVHFRREPLESPLNRIIKRIYDIFVSGTAVIVVLPWLCVLVWILQRFQSPGPLFFRQTRSGIGGGQFRIFKFRSMHAGSERDTSQAREQDPRIFPAGRWLRKTSLDEIPQFLNVLLGDMSVVGPRPHLPEHNSQWQRLLNAYNVRAIVKPGITGLAQVRGMRGEAKNDEDVVRRIDADLEYIENYSPLVDIAITAQTAWQVVFPKTTAY